jgi:hypothetical protein
MGHIINNYESILNKSDFFYKWYIRKCIELLKLVFTKYLHIFIIVKKVLKIIKIIMKLFFKKKNLYYYINV